MKIVQAFRIGRDPPNREDRTIGQVIVQFTTTETVQAILNLAKGSEIRNSFKEHIPEPYAGAHSKFIRVGIYLREEKGISCGIKFVQHSLQLQE